MPSQEFSYKTITSIEGDSVKCKVVFTPELHEVLKLYAVGEELLEDYHEDYNRTVNYQRFKIKGFVNNQLNQYSRLLFSESAVNEGFVEVEFQKVRYLTSFLNYIRQDIAKVLDCHFNVQGTREISITVEG